MAEKYLRGVVSIELGDVANDGGMGTSLTDIGKISKGTADFSQEDPTVNDFFSEQDDDPVDSVATKGKTTLKFAVIDYTPSVMESLLGGEVTGTTPDFVWEAPTTAPDIEKSIKVTTSTGVVLDIVRAKIRAKITAKLTKDALGLIEVTALVMTPTKAATAPFNVYEE